MNSQVGNHVVVVEDQHARLLDVDEGIDQRLEQGLFGRCGLPPKRREG
jgi:hypothetical protein